MQGLTETITFIIHTALCNTAYFEQIVHHQRSTLICLSISVLNRTNAGKNQMPRAGFEPTTPRSHDLGPGITSVGRRDMLIGPDVIDHTNVQHGIFRTNCSSSERSTHCFPRISSLEKSCTLTSTTLKL